MELSSPADAQEKWCKFLGHMISDNCFRIVANHKGMAFTSDIKEVTVFPSPNFGLEVISQ